MGQADRYYYPPGATEPVLRTPEPQSPDARDNSASESPRDDQQPEAAEVASSVEDQPATPVTHTRGRRRRKE